MMSRPFRIVRIRWYYGNLTIVYIANPDSLEDRSLIAGDTNVLFFAHRLICAHREDS